jgi:hypothetical protein
MKLLIKWPTRSRPKLFRDNLARYREYLCGWHRVQFVVTADLADPTMNNPEMRAHLDSIPELKYRFGDSKSKIEAVNADIDLADPWDVLLLASDDMVPVVKGFDDVIDRSFRAFYPDYNGALWFNDGLIGRRICTLSIMGRPLYDHFGYIYHPDYFSLYPDQEFTEECERMGRIRYFPNVIVAHGWESLTGNDSLHQVNTTPEVLAADKAIYERRRAAGFPKHSIHSPTVTV